MTDRPSWPRRLLASIRTRILVTSIVVLTVALGATALVTRQVLQGGIDARIDAELRQEAEELRLFAEEGFDPETGAPFGPDPRRLLEVFLARIIPVPGETMVTFVDGEPFRRTSQEVPYRIDTDPDLQALWADTTETLRGEVATPAGPLEYLAVPVVADEDPSAVFVVALFRDVVASEVDETVRVAGWAALASLLIGAALAFGLASRILDPLERLTRAAEEVSESDLSRRLEVRGADETARLTVTFNAMLDRLEEAFATQRRFIDDAGHELRSPITVIRGHLELLDHGDEADREATTALVLDELDRMHRIVEDLLLLAKSDQPDFVRPGPVDLGDLTRDVVRKAAALSAAHDWQLDAAADVVVAADRQRLTQALMQLCDNAAKHTPAGTTVRVGSVVSSGTVRLWVADDGPGIAPSDRDRVFERFTRAEAGRRGTDGAGLGLAIVRAIVEAHDGTIELTSAPGEGATFQLLLPQPDEAP